MCWLGAAGNTVGAMFRDGAWTEAISGRTFAVTNPATGEEIGQMPDGDAADATAAIDAAGRCVQRVVVDDAL